MIYIKPTIFVAIKLRRKYRRIYNFFFLESAWEETNFEISFNWEDTMNMNIGEVGCEDDGMVCPGANV